MKTLSRIYVHTTSGSSFYDNAGEKRERHGSRNTEHEWGGFNGFLRLYKSFENIISAITLIYFIHYLSILYLICDFIKYLFEIYLLELFIYEYIADVNVFLTNLKVYNIQI